MGFLAAVGIGCCIAGWDSQLGDAMAELSDTQVHLAKRDFHEALDCAKSLGLKGGRQFGATSKTRCRSSLVQDCFGKTCCKTTYSTSLDIRS